MVKIKHLIENFRGKLSSSADVENAIDEAERNIEVVQGDLISLREEYEAKFLDLNPDELSSLERKIDDAGREIARLRTYVKALNHRRADLVAAEEATERQREIAEAEKAQADGLAAIRDYETAASKAAEALRRLASANDVLKRLRATHGHQILPPDIVIRDQKGTRPDSRMYRVPDDVLLPIPGTRQTFFGSPKI